MKFLYAFLIFIGFTFSGCYTVLWNPEEQLPDENSYYGNGGSYADGYYSDPYYGAYSYYYETPWWLTMAPPTTSSPGDTKTTGRIKEIREVRNSGSGERNDVNQRIAPPTTGTSSGSSSSGSTTSGSVENTNKRDTNNSGNSTDDRNKVRNSGDRNSGGRK